MTQANTNIIYNKAFLQLLDSAKGINKSFRIEKEKDANDAETGNITIKLKGESVNLFVQANKSEFDFNGDAIAFYDYPEFSKIMTSFSYPSISQTVTSEDKEIFVLKSDKSKIEYHLADPAIFDSKTYKRPMEWVADVEFNLNKAQVKKLTSINSLFTSEYITFEFSKEDGKEVDVELSGSVRSDNKYVEKFEVISVSDDCPENVSIPIVSDVLSSLSDGDWNVKINVNGIVKFTQINDTNITFSLFTGQVVKD